MFEIEFVGRLSTKFITKFFISYLEIGVIIPPGVAGSPAERRAQNNAQLVPVISILYVYAEV